MSFPGSPSLGRKSEHDRAAFIRPGDGLDSGITTTCRQPLRLPLRPCRRRAISMLPLVTKSVRPQRRCSKPLVGALWLRKSIAEYPRYDQGRYEAPMALSAQSRCRRPQRRGAELRSASVTRLIFCKRASLLACMPAGKQASKQVS